MAGEFDNVQFEIVGIYINFCTASFSHKKRILKYSMIYKQIALCTIKNAKRWSRIFHDAD